MSDRIMVIGCCGAGKSVFSKKLAEKTGLPLIHLDKEYHGPNWTKPTREAWLNKLSEICARDKWIIDGNYIGSMEQRIKRADLVVFLDINRFTCLFRAVSRALRTSQKHRTDMADGCSERHDLTLYKFIWRFHKDTRPLILRIFEEHKDVRVVTVRNKADKNRLIEQL